MLLVGDGDSDGEHNNDIINFNTINSFFSFFFFKQTGIQGG